jgi:glycosyltransferase involved in cell wall biosynthesis
MRGVDFTCHLIGDGPRRKDIERQIERSGIKDVVVLHGARTRREVGTAWSRAAMPRCSRVSQLELQARRDPGCADGSDVRGPAVVASRTVRDSRTCESRSQRVSGGRPPIPVALAGALERLALDAPLRERMGRAGRETIIRELTRSSVAADLVGLDSAVRRPRRCGRL